MPLNLFHLFKLFNFDKLFLYLIAKSSIRFAGWLADLLVSIQKNNLNNKFYSAKLFVDIFPLYLAFLGSPFRSISTKLTNI